MRLIIQRVLEASVQIEGAVQGRINKGLLIFLGIHHSDTLSEVNKWVDKVLHLRIFSDEKGKMNLNVKDIGGEVLIVSQFTLYGNCASGRRPDFLQAAPPAIAFPIYQHFVDEIKQGLGHVQTGEFGADMRVSLINDGPVTFFLE